MPKKLSVNQLYECNSICPQRENTFSWIKNEGGGGGEGWDWEGGSVSGIANLS